MTTAEMEHKLLDTPVEAWVLEGEKRAISEALNATIRVEPSNGNRPAGGWSWNEVHP